MLINEAIDAVLHARRVAGGHRSRDDEGGKLSQGVAGVGERDRARIACSAWLERLQSDYGEDRYRPSPLLRRMVRDGRTVLRMTPTATSRRWPSASCATMMARDAFSQWLGIEVVWTCAARRDGAHDGARRHAERFRRVSWRRRRSRSPTARWRSRATRTGSVTVSIENSITYPEGDLRGRRADGAWPRRRARRNRLAFYRVTVRRGGDESSRCFAGRCTRPSKPFFARFQND